MKKELMTVMAAAICAWSSGCASGAKNVAQEASRGPVIINPRSVPEKVELNRFLQAKQPQQFFTEIQDIAAPVQEAKLRINGTSITIPLEKVGGTTWRGELSSDQIKKLAISGKTVEYSADIVARDQNGVVGSSKESFRVAVSAPAFEADSG